MSTWMILLVVAYVMAFIYFSLWEAMQWEFVTPRWFYENIKLNWFGSCLAFVLLSMISPVVFVLKIIFVIFLGIRWLLTVGR